MDMTDYEPHYYEVQPAGVVRRIEAVVTTAFPVLLCAIMLTFVVPVLGLLDHFEDYYEQHGNVAYLTALAVFCLPIAIVIIINGARCRGHLRHEGA